MPKSSFPLLRRALHAGAILAILVASPSAWAQPRPSVGFETGVVVGPNVHGLGATFAPVASLQWGRLDAGLQPAAYARSTDDARFCDTVPPGPDTPCWRDVRSTLTSSFRAGYALPVHGALALTAGAGVRYRWYDALARQRIRDGSIGSERGWEGPHIVLGARYTVSEHFSVSLQTETRVYREITIHNDEAGNTYFGDGLRAALARVTVGVEVPLRRARR